MQTLWQDLRYGARMLLKKPVFTLLASFTLVLGTGMTAEPQAANTSPTLEQILDRYVQAIGGRGAAQAITSRMMEGSIAAPALGSAQGTIVIYAKAPNKLLTEIKAPVLGSLRTGFNGKLAWEEENSKVREAPEFVKREADFYFLLKLRELYPRLELKGKERIGNAETWRLDAPRGGRPKRWYFDVNTGLLLRTEVRDAADKLVSSEDYEDYRAVDGVLVAFITRSFEDNFNFVIKLNEVKHNIEIDDALFEKPEARAAAVPLSAAERNAAAQLQAETIRAVTTALAAREMEGRGMAQAGGERAAQYLANRFAQVGLKPGGETNYQQRIKLKITTLLPTTSFRVGSHVFKFKHDFALAQPPDGLQGASGKLVLAGYGVVSDELKRNDLAGIDVKGKLVMILKGKPENADAALWSKVANERTVFGRLIEKGAAGFVVIYQGEAARFPAVAAIVSQRQVSLAEPLPYLGVSARWSIELLASEFKLPPSVLIGESAAEQILGAGGASFTRVKQQAEAGEFVSRELNLRASIAPRFKREEGTSSNVIGFIEGADAKLKSEAVVYTAHYDAYGIDTEGTIYTGAADNALGVGKLLAAAEVFARMTPSPRRSIIFMATTGEEYDDLGAEYWLRHPTWPLEKVAANINYDGSVLEVWGRLKFVPDYGFQHSDLNEVVGSVAAASGLQIIPDPVPEESFFYRSDQYAFVKRGIPALFLTGIPDEEPQALLERAGKWQAANYHLPTDTVQPDWNWEGARMLASFGMITGMRIANQEAMPAWKPNSTYNRPRGTTLPPPPRQ